MHAEVGRRLQSRVPKCSPSFHYGGTGGSAPSFFNEGRLSITNTPSTAKQTRYSPAAAAVRTTIPTHSHFLRLYPESVNGNAPTCHPTGRAAPETLLYVLVEPAGLAYAFLLRVAEACSRFSSVESSRFFSPRNCRGDTGRSDAWRCREIQGDREQPLLLAAEL